MCRNVTFPLDLWILLIMRRCLVLRLAHWTRFYLVLTTFNQESHSITFSPQSICSLHPTRLLAIYLLQRVKHPAQITAVMSSFK